MAFLGLYIHIYIDLSDLLGQFRLTVMAYYCILQFLSMKLATVNPELNIDLDQIFSKDVSTYYYLKFFISRSKIIIKFPARY